MRYLPRIQLPQRVLDALESYQSAIDIDVKAELEKAKPKTHDVIQAAWKSHRNNKALEAAETALRAMASGLERCMYCEDSRGCDVEHLRPKASYADRMFAWLNLLWICADCNRQKNDAFDDAMLDPTAADPLDHLVLSLATGRYTPRGNSPRGVATLRVVPRLESNQMLTRGRRNAMVKLRSLLADYDAHRAARRDAEADAVHRAMVEEPFSAVFAAVLRASTEPGAQEVLGAELLAVLSRHPEMDRWLADADEARALDKKADIASIAKLIHLPRNARQPAAKRARRA